MPMPVMATRRSLPDALTIRAPARSRPAAARLLRDATPSAAAEEATHRASRCFERAATISGTNSPGSVTSEKLAPRIRRGTLIS